MIRHDLGQHRILAGLQRRVLAEEKDIIRYPRRDERFAEPPGVAANEADSGRGELLPDLVKHPQADGID